MTNQLDIDPVTIALLQGADPLRNPRMEADAGLDTEAALRVVLAQAATERHQRGTRTRSRRRRAWQLGLVATGAAAAAFAIVNVSSDGGHGSVASADAATILARASSALTASPGQVAAYTVSGPDGSTATWAVDGASPQDFVFTQHGGGVDLIDGQQDGMLEFYDRATNTIYRDSDTARAQTISPNALLQEVQTNGRTVVDRHATLHGRRAESITSTGTRGIVYELWVDPVNSDRPLQLTVTPKTGSPLTSTWSNYQTITPSASVSSPALLTDRYPSAPVKTLDDAAYLAIGHQTDDGANGR